MESLLTSLRRARWNTALYTLGNSHSTLIGLIVDWWISGAELGGRWVLEAPPSFSGRRCCDAVLYEGIEPRGVVEVEGQSYVDKLAHLESFFNLGSPYLRSLQFGILLAYAYVPNAFPAPPLEDLVRVGKEITLKHPGKEFVILSLEKTYQSHLVVPGKTGYYTAKPVRVRGRLLNTTLSTRQVSALARS